MPGDRSFRIALALAAMSIPVGFCSGLILLFSVHHNDGLTALEAAERPSPSLFLAVSWSIVALFLVGLGIALAASFQRAKVGDEATQTRWKLVAILALVGLPLAVAFGYFSLDLCADSCRVF